MWWGALNSQAALRRSIRAAIEPLESRLLLAADLKFAVIGDFSIDNGAAPETAVSNLVKSWNPSFVVTVGDNNYPNGAASTIDANIGQFYQQYIFPYKGSFGPGSPDGVNHFFPALGNHDWVASGATPYLNYFTLPGNERYYTTQVGNVGIFVVDSDPSEPDGNTATSVQGKWLQGALAASTAQYKLVFFHHPPFTSGGIGDSAWMDWPFAQWGATAVFSGHEHDYERLTEHGIPYFVDGLGGESITGFKTPVPGSQVRYAGNYGGMLLDASSTSITFQFINISGTVIDSFTLGTVTAPAAPTALQANPAGSSQINLSWTDNSSNETGFKIERSIDGVNFTQVALTGAGVVNYSDTGLASGTKYFYRVRATNSAGDSAYTNIANATTIVAGTTTYLSDATWVSATTGFGTIQLDKSMKGNPITINGVIYSKGIGVNAISQIVYNLGGKYINFLSDVGLDDEDAFGSVDFTVVADGKTIYDSGKMLPKAVQHLNLDVTGVQQLTLNVGDAGDGIDGDDAVWAGARVVAAATPAVPAAPVLSATPVGATQINLSWTESSTNASGFLVERSTDNLNFTQIGTTVSTVLAYSDTAVTAGTTYFYRVRATSSVGNSTYSNVASAAGLTPPAAPSNLIATAASTTQINVTWQLNSTTGSGNAVERSTDGVNFTQIAVVDDTLTSYSDTGLTPGATYYYRVRVVNPAGNSPYSNIGGATTLASGAVTYLSDIAWVSATTGFGTIQLDKSVLGNPITVNSVVYPKGIGTHAISQIVYNLGGNYANFISDIGLDDEDNFGSVTFQVIADGTTIYSSGTMITGSTTQHLNLNVAGVQQLTLVVGDNGDGFDGDHADWAGARLVAPAPPAAPPAPVDLAATASVSQVNLAWVEGSNIQTGFTIERSTNNISFIQIGTAGPTASTYNDPTALAGTTYYYRVKAMGTAGNSGYSNVCTGSVAGPTLPAAPAAPAMGGATISATQVTLNWTETTTDVTSYTVLRSTDNATFAAVGTAAGTSTNYTDSTVAPATTYYYQVVASNIAGNSPASNTTTAVTSQLAPAAPTAMTATAASPTQVNLAWTDNSSNETGFKVERSADGGTTFTQIALTAAGAIAYSDTTAVAGATYTYRVKATNAAGDSAYATAAAITTPALPSPWAQGDIGNVGVKGSATWSAGVYTVKGGGAQISGSNDAFHYVYQSLTGDGTIVARVTAVGNTNASAGAGVMIRESLAAGAREASVLLTVSKGITFGRRTSTGGSTASSSASGVAAPYWVKLVRSGNTFTAYRSSNGTTWTQIGSTATITMASTVYIGLAVTAHNNTAASTSTFDNVTVTGGVVAQSLMSGAIFSTTLIQPASTTPLTGGTSATSLVQSSQTVL